LGAGKGEHREWSMEDGRARIGNAIRFRLLFACFLGSKNGENPLWTGLDRFSPVCVGKNIFDGKAGREGQDGGGREPVNGRNGEMAKEAEQAAKAGRSSRRRDSRHSPCMAKAGRSPGSRFFGQKAGRKRLKIRFGPVWSGLVRFA